MNTRLQESTIRKVKMIDDIVPEDKGLDVSADKRPWVVGYSGGKTVTMLVSLVVDAVAGIEERIRDKEVAVVLDRHPR